MNGDSEIYEFFHLQATILLETRFITYRAKYEYVMNIRIGNQVDANQKVFVKGTWVVLRSGRFNRYLLKFSAFCIKITKLWVRTEDARYQTCSNLPNTKACFNGGWMCIMKKKKNVQSVLCY